MPIKEILQGIVFFHRVVDHRDFNEVVNCIPDSRMKYLEDGLASRRDAGEIETIQIARYRKESHPLSPEEDQIDELFEKIDASRLHSSMDRATSSEDEDSGSIPDEASSFTGFNDVYDTSRS